MVQFDNYRDRTWRAFRLDEAGQATECLAIIEKAGPQQFRVNTFKGLFEFKKLRRAQRWVRETL